VNRLLSLLSVLSFRHPGTQTTAVPGSWLLSLLSFCPSKARSVICCSDTPNHPLKFPSPLLSFPYVHRCHTPFATLC